MQSDHIDHSHVSGEFERRLTPFLCGQCRSDFTPATSPLCQRCGHMFISREGEDHFCGDCLKEDLSKGYRKARAAGVYEGAFRTLIHRFKYDGKIGLTEAFGRLLWIVFTKNWPAEDIDMVLPVPLHIKRLRKRGFNQAYLIIKDWKRFGRQYGIDISGVHIQRDVLIRSKWTEPQVNIKDKEARRKNIRNAFSISDHAEIQQKKILLVDDVFTTGATVNECARILLKNGAQHVDVLTLAHVRKL